MGLECTKPAPGMRKPDEIRARVLRISSHPILGEMKTMQGSLTEQITRSLAYMLRHQPEEFDLELDPEGWADLGDVVSALNERLGEPVHEDDVYEAIESGDRPRYSIEDGRVCALYGHSIQIEPGKASEPPEFLFVGIGSRDADRARRNGLRAGRRTFLHLALTEGDARESGRRAAPEYAVVTVNARDAWDDGIDFYNRKSLFLSESIPVDFLDVGELYDDGIRRESGRSRGGRRSGGRGRGRGRGRSPRRDDDYEPRLRKDADFDAEDNRRERFGDERKPAPEKREEAQPKSQRQGADRESARREPASSKNSESGAGGFGAGI